VVQYHTRRHPAQTETTIRFTRAHGLGNDYLVLETKEKLTAPLVTAICDRHTGIGSDGILEPFDDEEADYGVRIHNPDGSLAEKSGNGLRIFARWIANKTEMHHFTLSTGFCIVSVHVGPKEITVEMGQATFAPKSVPVVSDLPLINAPLSVAGETLMVTAVGIGNPHCVHFCDNPDHLNWRQLGKEIETHPRFPNRVNVQFANVLGPQRLGLRIWERGAGETSASGSSSCAVAVVAVKMGLVKPNQPISMVMQGGELQVTVTEGFAVTLTGPVEIVGSITINRSWLARHTL
jgi:diaminopimelate epimerase